MAIPPDISRARAPTLSELGLAQEPAAKQPTKELGQAEFFDLMVAQLKFQDPLKPLENTEFISQMAQFSSVNSLGDIRGSLKELVGSFQSNQALQASTLVGRDVLIPSSTAALELGKAVGGMVELAEPAANLRISVINAAGELVRQIELGAQPPGSTRFTWDGFNDEATAAAPGVYTFLADAQIGESRIGIETLMQVRVDSVTLRQNPPGATLNLAGIGPVDMSAVRELL